MFKKISAFAAAAAIAAMMAVPAFATTYEDCVQAAKEAGVPDYNVQQLSNFLEPNADQFTSDEYDDMIATLNKVRDEYVFPAAQKLFGLTDISQLADLTEEQKEKIRNYWSAEERQAIYDTLVKLGEKYGVTISLTYNDEYGLADGAAATIKRDSSTNKDGGGVTTPLDPPVAATGAATEDTTSNAAPLAAAVTLAVAGLGVVVISKKNKA